MAVVLLSACGGSAAVKASKSFVQQVERLAGTKATKIVEFSGDDITRFAQKVGVDQSVARQAALYTEKQPLWQRSMDRIETAYTSTPGVIRSKLVSMACDIWADNITVDQLNEEIDSLAADGFQVDAVVSAVNGIIQDRNEADASQDANMQRMVSMFMCEAVEKIVG